MAWRRRTLARATTAQIAATTYGLGEPIINKDAGPEKSRFHVGDGVTAGGKPLAFKAEVDAVSGAFSGHGHVSGDITDLPEFIRDTVATFIVAGTNMTKTHNDPGDTLTLDAAGGSGAANLDAPVNLGIAASAASNALTVTLTGAAGAALSGANKAIVPMRSSSGGSGVLNFIEYTTPLSLVLSAGSTLGAQAGRPLHLWLVVFDDAGTRRLGLVQCLNPSALNVMPLLRRGIASATAEGGVGAADSAQVIYADAAVASRPYTLLARLVWNNIVTPGNWTAPDGIQASQELPLPGTTIGPIAHVLKTDTFSGTSTALADITGLSVSFTLSAPGNLTRNTARASYFVDGANSAAIAMIRGSTNVGGGAAAGSRPSALAGLIRVADGNSQMQMSATVLDAPGTVASTTVKLQYEAQSAGTFWLGRGTTDTDSAGVPRTSSSLIIEEIVA